MRELVALQRGLALQSFAPADVIDRYNGEPLAVDIDRRESDLDIDAAVVAAYGGQFGRGARLPAPRQRLALIGIRAAGAGRNQRFDADPDQLRAGVSEHRLRLPVRESDRAAIVGHHDSRRHGFEQAPDELTRNVALDGAAARGTQVQAHEQDERDRQKRERKIYPSQQLARALRRFRAQHLPFEKCNCGGGKNAQREHQVRRELALPEPARAMDSRERRAAALPPYSIGA
ncbi:MAG TPA: hypothetical protein VLK83_12955 [Rhodanobacteraceae bacterium]|nr:hypothetical protein [Rhodanobacteraceae bacterium]